MDPLSEVPRVLPVNITVHVDIGEPIIDVIVVVDVDVLSAGPHPTSTVVPTMVIRSPAGPIPVSIQP
jgi:hypothetical protein